MDAAIRTSGFSCTCHHADKDRDTNQAGDKHRGLNKEMLVMVMITGMPEKWRHSMFNQLCLLGNCKRTFASDCFCVVDGDDLYPTLNFSTSW